MPLAERVQTAFGATSTARLYGGLYLLAGGVALGLTALFLFFLSSGATIHYGLREAALASGATAIMVFFLGVNLALPAPRSMRIAAAAGVGVCLVAIVLFLAHYPRNFNVSTAKDYTGIDTIIFAVGLVGIIAGACASVVGYYIDRIKTAQADKDVDDAFGRDYTVPDHVIEQDLEEAGKRHRFTWGGASGPRRDDYVTMDLGAHITAPEMRGRVRRVQVEATQVAEAEDAIRSHRERTRPSLPGAWADDGAQALRSFRARQAAAPKVFAPRVRWHQRLRDRLFGRPQ